MVFWKLACIKWVQGSEEKRDVKDNYHVTQNWHEKPGRWDILNQRPHKKHKNFEEDVSFFQDILSLRKLSYMKH